MMKMASYLTIFCVLYFILHFQGGINAGYCTEYYDCTKTCQRVVRTTTSSWIFWEETAYRTENYICQGTCSRDVCCSGFTGTYCTTDIDECEDWTKCSQNCVNTYGSYRCTCNSGYDLLSDGYSCQDEDECSSWNNWSWYNAHNCAHICTNTPGSYSCSCNNGYRLLIDGYSCQDVDECGEGTSGCKQSCLNTDGSYRCSCNHGYELSADGKSCHDINECSRGTAGCQQNCINTIGSYTCSCYVGFHLNIDEMSCTDIDECEDGTAECNVHCENTAGSYACGCNKGFMLTTSGINCEDIDECSEGNGGCAQTCENEPGSYNCSCEEGFQLDTDGQSCFDIDECEEGTSECEVHCENTVGSYACGCNLGFILTTNGINCEDIDECSESNGGCAQTCENEPGSYYCSCEEGLQLDTNGKTCFDIDECEQGIAGCSHSCENTRGSYICSCDTGYELVTDLHTCSDINECLLLNGGCQEVCTNTEGAFECGCFDRSEIQKDGVSCSRDKTKGTVFERYKIAGSLLPEACFSLSVTQCMNGSDMTLKSTSEWFQQQEQPSVFYTFGITFVKTSTISLPLSLRGLKVKLSEADCRFSLNIISSGEDNVLEMDESVADCRTFNLTDLDIYDFLSHGSFLRSYLLSLSTSLPNWINFDESSDSSVDIQDVKSDIIYGDNMKDTEWCSEAPIVPDHLYNVFRFDTVFSLILLGDDIKIPLPAKGNRFCLIVDLSFKNKGSFFLMVPEESRSFFESINIFKKLKQTYGLSVLPRGIGLSVITSQSTALELWNGDTMFQYHSDHLSTADVWIGGDISIDGDHWAVRGSADFYLGVPNLETILTSVYLDQWNAYALVQMSPVLKFRLFGNYFEVDLGKYKNAEVEAYISIGGKQRSWCGETSNPAGIFFTVQMELGTPFEGVPFLEKWQSSLRQKAYVFSTYEPSLVPSKINIKSYMLNLENSVENMELMTFEFQELNDGISIKNMKNTTVNDILPIVTSLKELIQNIKASLDTETFEDIKPLVDKVWKLFSELKHQITLFFYDTAFIEKEQLSHFKNDINIEINSFDVEVTRLLMNITNTVIKEATSFSGFGIKYIVNPIVMTLQLGEFEIEMVYSTDSLFKCSRFGKVMEHLRGEEAMRVLGRATVQKKLNNFFSYEKGIGIGAALSVNNDKFVVQLQLFAKLLGMKATGDLFLTNNGLYLYLEGNIWDIFLAQLDVSAEIGNKWYDLVIRVQGRFVAKARKRRQIQTVSSSFEDSYLDALKKLINVIADGAQRRLDQAQDGITSAQNKLTDAQIWVRKKQENIDNAYAVFDKAVASLEIAKVKLEEAKEPFEEALEKLRNAQRNVDNLCKIKTCDYHCILPKLQCNTCWDGWIPYPCCKRTGCLLSIPDPICVAANVACRIARGIAYGLLEAAQLFVKLPIIAFDTAKAAVSVAQIIVDKSRVAVFIASSVLELAHTGLELAKGVFEAAKLVLEGVKYALGAAVNVLTFVIEYGIQSILDVKNCGFDVEISTKDLPVFSVFCDVNAFKLGWKTILIKINFKNILQSIWNAARATIDLLMKQIGNVFGIGRKRREITFRASAKVHARILRTIREVGPEETNFNESIDISNNITGMGIDIEEDYSSRVLLFDEKCRKMTVVMDFMHVAFESLQDIVNESMISINEISSLIDDLQQYSTTGLADDITFENLGIDKDHAENDYNMTDDDFEKLMENITQAIENDLLLAEISTVANASIENMAELKESIESINFLDSWFVSMANTSKDYFNSTECFDFKDCVFYSISTLYDLYEAEDVPDIDDIRTSIIDLEAVLIELFQNETHMISDISMALDYVRSNVTYLSEANPFCSLAPTFVSVLENQTVLNSTDVIFTCNATGDPFPQFWWFKDDEYLTQEQSMRMTILSATLDDGGIYTCIAGNVVANITSHEAQLLVIMHDENECETRNGDCDHICTNVIGSFKCSCRQGYTLNEDMSTCTGESNDGEIGGDLQITKIALFASGALFSTVVIAVAVFIVYTKLSKTKVVPNIGVQNSVYSQKILPGGPMVEVEERSAGPIKTSFNKHVFTTKVIPMK